MRVLRQGLTLLALSLIVLFNYPALTSPSLLHGHETSATTPNLSAESPSANPNYVLGGANSTMVCAGMGGSWNSNSYTCTLTSSLNLNATGEIDVVSGFLVIARGVSLGNYGAVYGLGTLENNGTIDNTGSVGIGLVNYGTIDNYGSIDNVGTFLNCGNILNAGILDNYIDDIVDNKGSIQNSYTIDNSFRGTINNYPNSTISNYGGTITSQGTINNNGTIVNNGSGILTTGVIDNSNYVFNRGTIINGEYGSIYNHFEDVSDLRALQTTYGQIDNYAMMDNYGSLTNDGYGGVGVPGGTSVFINNYNGTINNYDRGTMNLYFYSFLDNYYGKITLNNGVIMNDRGTIDNYYGTITVNDGILNNGYVLNNYGTINNKGNVTNLKSMGSRTWYGALENHGTVNNNGTVTNNWVVANYDTFNNGGIIYNNGTIFRDYRGGFTNHNGGTVKTYGNGTVTDCFVYLELISVGRFNYTSNECGSTDYSLKISPRSVTIHQGSSGIVRVAVTAAFPAFPGNVTLSTGGASSGITVSLSALTVSQLSLQFPSYANMTISVAGSVAPGSYNIHIDGTSGPLVHSADLDIVVIPPPGFTIVANHTLTIDARCPYCPSFSGNVPITVTFLYGFVGTINLTATSPPPLSCNVFNQAQPLLGSSVQPSGSPSKVYLICTTDDSASGDFPVTITATSGHAMKQITLTVHIISAPSTSTSPPFKFSFNPVIIYAILGGVLALLAVIFLRVVFGRRRRRSRMSESAVTKLSILVLRLLTSPA